jgi:hypothetical protein
MLTELQMERKKKEMKKLKYVICRTYSAGVFAGYLVSRKGQEVVMKDARRLWYWKGAASLSQLANEGVKYPAECKFPTPVSIIELTQAIEILSVTPQAQKIIESVPVWSA